MEHELQELIKKCDLVIKQEDFDALMNYLKCEIEDKKGHRK
jgi:hypothetical protein